MVRFAAVDAQGNELAYPYEDRWSRQRTSGPDRLVIAPAAGRHVDVLLELTRQLREPFGILYVLLLSRTDEHEAGRYQVPRPLSRAEMEAFVLRFREYLEGDGRHHLWIASMPDNATLVLDHHDLVYAYGPLDPFAAALAAGGFREAPVTVPAPHQHRYDPRFDQAEREVMAAWAWRRVPLQPSDEH